MFRRDVCAHPVPREKINHGIPLSSFTYMECNGIYCKYAPHHTSNTILIITIGQDVIFHHYGVTDKALKHYPTIQSFLSLCITLCMSDLLWANQFAFLDGAGHVHARSVWEQLLQHFTVLFDTLQSLQLIIAQLCSFGHLDLCNV